MKKKKFYESFELLKKKTFFFEKLKNIHRNPADAKNWPEKLATTFSRTYSFLCQKWYFDELYEKIFS